MLIVGPKYGERHYCCEIIVSVEDLLPWVKHHAETVCCSHQKTQTARKALPLWLGDADTSNNTASKIPHYMYEVLRPYISQFVDEGAAKIFCSECQSFVSDVRREKRDEVGCAIAATWTDVWTCPQGHQLYYEEHEMRLHYGKDLPVDNTGIFEIPSFFRSRQTDR